MAEPEVIVSIRPPFVDERGEILNLVDDVAFTSASVIKSKAGAVRGNHYHKTDFHYCWLQSGGMIYYHRPVGSTAPAQQWMIKAGQMFYTPPLYEHTMQFTEDSVFFVFARNNRFMADYEADIIRVKSLVQ